MHIFPGNARKYHRSGWLCVSRVLFITKRCPRFQHRCWEVCIPMYCLDLSQILGTEEAIVDALRNRFNELPFHSKMYYKFYHDQMTTEEIMNTFIIGQNGELDPTGLQQ